MAGVFGGFFFYLLIYQSIILAIGSLVTQIMDTCIIAVAQMGSAVLTPLLARTLAWESSFQLAISGVYTSAWALVTVFFAFTAHILPQEICILRAQMHSRAEMNTQASNA